MKEFELTYEQYNNFMDYLIEKDIRRLIRGGDRDGFPV